MALVVQEVIVPQMDIIDPVVRGGWKTYDGWIWWVWEFRSGWQEWIPCYAHLLKCVTHHFFMQHGRLDLDVIMAIQQHVDGLMAGLWRDYLEDQQVEFSPEAQKEDQMQYCEHTLVKSQWYYNSIPGYGTWAAVQQ